MSAGTGPDDLLARSGRAAIEKVIADAMPADPLPHIQAKIVRSSTPAIALDECSEDKPLLVALLERGKGCQHTVAEIYRAHRRKGRLDDALRAAGQELQEQQASSHMEALDEPRYKIIHGQLHMKQLDRWQKLSNFVAYIVLQVTVDDGAGEQLLFEIEGVTCEGSVLPRIRITPTAFMKEPWWMMYWGAAAIAEPGALLQGHLRVAIQIISNPKKHTSFGHTGWRNIDDIWVFLHGGGAVGADGVDVQLGGTHAQYVLTSGSCDAREDLGLALKVLQVAPPKVAYLLLLAAFRAPLCEVLAVDGAIYLFGRTGSLKSSLAAIIGSFFAQGLTHALLPASFADTAASIELTLYVLKDTVVILDELVPRSTDPNDEARKKAISVMRLVGNGAPRGRLRTDLSAMPSRPCRALLIMTGEEALDGESAAARTMSIEFRRDTVHQSVLTELQANRERLSHAMVGYLRHMAPRLEALRAWAPGRHRELQRQFQHDGDHLRASSMAAHLALAADTFADYAREVGVFDKAAARRFVADAHAALAKAVRAQTSETREENPARRFLNLLGELLRTSQVRLLDRSENVTDQGAWPPVIGWRDQGNLLLLPDSSYKAVAEFARSQGQPLSLRSRSMGRALRDLGVLARQEDEHCTIQRMVGGKKTRVFELTSGALEDHVSPGSTPYDESGARSEEDLP